MNEQLNSAAKLVSFDCAMPILLATQEMMVKYWKTFQEIHGTLDVYFSPNFAASKERTQLFLQGIPSFWSSEDAAKNNIKTDREGAAGLLVVTLWQACVDEWSVQDRRTLSAARIPDIAMDTEQFERAGAIYFCMLAIRNYPIFSR